MKFRFFNKPVISRECDIPALVTGVVGLALSVWSLVAVVM